MRGINEFIQSLREIYQIVSEGVLLTDLNGKIVFLNNSLLTYRETQEKKWLNKPVSDFLMGLDPSAQLKTLRKKKAISKDISLTDKKGKSNPIQALVILLESDQEEVGLIYITRIIKNNLKPNPYSDKNNPIVSVLNVKKNEIWFITDFQKYHTLFCSNEIKQLCGWSSEEFILGGWVFSFIMMHPLDRRRIINIMMEELAHRNNHKFIYDHVPISVEFRFRTRENTWVWFKDQRSVLERDEAGKIKYMIGSITKLDPTVVIAQNSATQLLEEDILIRDGKTYVNLDTLLAIQKSNMRQHVSSSELLVNSYHLTNRELEILSLIVQGLSSDEIGEKIHITKNTVNMHRKQIMKKMQAKNLADLVRKSMENGLFSKIVQ